MRKKLIVGIMAAIMSVGLSMTSFAGTWKQDNVGWWYQNTDNSYPKSAWMQDTDGKWYCFDANGYMVANKWEWIDGNNDGIAECYGFDSSGKLYVNTFTPDGYAVDSSGAWTVNGILQQQGVASGNGTTGSTGTSTSNDATNIYADFTTDFDANWKVVYMGTNGQILKNQWLFFGLYGDQARWVYLDSNGYEIVNGTSPDGYPLDGVGFYYATATEADKAAYAARSAASAA